MGKGLKPRGQDGFSLIELMVTVAIISTLASIAIPNYQSFAGRARDVRRVAEMHGYIKAMQMYYFEKGRYPDQANDGISNSGTYLGRGYTIDTVLAPYFDGHLPDDPSASVDPSVYFYSYDPQHCTDLATPGDCLGPSGIALAFNKAEVGVNGIVQQTRSGCDMNICNSDFNYLLQPGITDQ